MYSCDISGAGCSQERYNIELIYITLPTNQNTYLSWIIPTLVHTNTGSHVPGIIIFTHILYTNKSDTYLCNSVQCISAYNVHHTYNVRRTPYIIQCTCLYTKHRTHTPDGLCHTFVNNGYSTAILPHCNRNRPN